MSYPSCYECGEPLRRCHMGCGEMRCANECDGTELQHERDHGDDDEREYEDRLRDLNEEFDRCP